MKSQPWEDGRGGHGPGARKKFVQAGVAVAEQQGGEFHGVSQRQEPDDVRQGTANASSKVSRGKLFRVCRLYGFGYNHSTLPFMEKAATADTKMNGCVHIPLKQSWQKQTLGWLCLTPGPQLADLWCKAQEAVGRCLHFILKASGNLLFNIFWAEKYLEGQGQVHVFLCPHWTEQSTWQAPALRVLSITPNFSSYLLFLNCRLYFWNPPQSNSPKLPGNSVFPKIAALNHCPSLCCCTLRLEMASESRKPCLLLVTDSVL